MADDSNKILDASVEVPMSKSSLEPHQPIYVLEADMVGYAEANLRIKEKKLMQREEQLEIQELRYLHDIQSTHEQETMLLAMDRGLKYKAQQLPQEALGVLKNYLKSEYQAQLEGNSEVKADHEVAQLARKKTLEIREKAMLARFEAVNMRVKQLTPLEQDLLQVKEKLYGRKVLLEQMQEHMKSQIDLEPEDLEEPEPPDFSQAPPPVKNKNAVVIRVQLELPRVIQAKKSDPVVKKSENETGHFFFHPEDSNITEGGMFLATEGKFSEETPVQLIIEIAQIGSVTLFGESGWCRSYDASQPDKPAGVGIQFTEKMNEIDQSRLELYFEHYPPRRV
jgi:hypothetical protein